LTRPLRDRQHQPLTCVNQSHNQPTDDLSHSTFDLT
jgi:hypothetical protein